MLALALVFAFLLLWGLFSAPDGDIIEGLRYAVPTFAAGVAVALLIAWLT